MGDKKYMAGLYLRLSKDDERAGESVSIENQRLLLTNYAHEKGWEIRETYIDDGWSGTNMQRPAFQRMMRDAEDRRINLIVVKDLSRLGRNYIEVGRLTEEILPRLGCRFVALNDSVDSIMGENDMMVYRNLFNEFYSKDTSKKVRAVRQSCMKQGKFLGTYAPLGYKKDPENKHYLIIDNETADIIRRMFDMRVSGSTFRSIATTFNNERVPSSKTIYYSRIGRDNPLKANGSENGLWNESSVKAILRNEVYIGNMVSGKQGTQSYKTHKLVAKPKESWVRVEGTHEPLISREVWDMARELDEKSFKPRQAPGAKQSIFVGVLKCADCGFNMRALSRNNPDGPGRYVEAFICGNYARSGKSACTVHSINEAALTQMVLEEIRSRAKLVAYDERRVADMIMKAKNRETITYLATYKQQLKSCEERLRSLDGVIATLYEDRVSGVVTESIFAALMGKYDRERDENAETVKLLRRKIEACERDSGDIDSWMNIIKNYANLEELTQKILLELIESIYVSEAKKVGGKREYSVEIVYRLVGSISGMAEGGADYAEAV